MLSCCGKLEEMYHIQKICRWFKQQEQLRTFRMVRTAQVTRFPWCICFCLVQAAMLRHAAGPHTEVTGCHGFTCMRGVSLNRPAKQFQASSIHNVSLDSIAVGQLAQQRAG